MDERDEEGSRRKTAEEARPIAREERDATICLPGSSLCPTFPAAGNESNPMTENED